MQTEQKYITALGIPVEILILFLTHSLKEFTATDIKKEFFLKHKIELQEKRVTQILNELVQMEKIFFVVKKNGKNKDTRFYKFNKLA